MESQDLVTKMASKDEAMEVILHALEEAMLPFRAGTIEIFFTDIGNLDIRVMSMSDVELFRYKAEKVVLMELWDVIIVSHVIFMEVRRRPRIEAEAHIILGEN